MTKLYLNERAADAAGAAPGKTVAVDDLFLTTDLPTTAGSKMLEGYMSLFEAEAVTRLRAAGYALAGKANVGEFGADLLGETSVAGACVHGGADGAPDGTLAGASAELVRTGAVAATVSLDVNGAPRRAAAQAGLTHVKPTYGTVSRFGTIAVACSGETISVTAADAAACREVLSVLAGHDDKDGTSLPQERCEQAAGAAGEGAGATPAPADSPIARVAVSRALAATAGADVQEALAAFEAQLAACGIEVVDANAQADDVIARSNIAWNILMSAELCNNVSRFDGVKYGHRAADYEGIAELYTNSRTEGFGPLAKTLILFGSETLSTDNYDAVYDKALRVRRLVVEAFAHIFEGADAVLLPAASKRAFTAADVEADRYLALKENRFTAPASLSGLPAVIAGGMQLVGPALSDARLLALAERLEAAPAPAAGAPAAAPADPARPETEEA